MIRSLCSIALLAGALALPLAAVADSVTYTIPASGVSCDGSAAHAERAVLSAGKVKAVEADPSTHEVKATFDDQEISLAAIVESLENAGMSVGEPVKVQ